MLVIIKFEGLSLRLVFWLIVVVLIHIRSMIKQTAVVPNFPPSQASITFVLLRRRLIAHSTFWSIFQL